MYFCVIFLKFHNCNFRADSKAQLLGKVNKESQLFEIDSYIKGYHVYQNIWTSKLEEMLPAIPEPTNPVDKYAVCVIACVIRGEKIVGHLEKGKNGRFGKTIFYFLRADPGRSKCTVMVKGKAVNLGDGDGMQVPCRLKLEGDRDFVTLLKKQLID